MEDNKMDFYKEQLLKFRELNLSKKELMDTVPKDFESDEPILICNSPGDLLT